MWRERPPYLSKCWEWENLDHNCWEDIACNLLRESIINTWKLQLDNCRGKETLPQNDQLCKYRRNSYEIVNLTSRPLSFKIYQAVSSPRLRCSFSTPIKLCPLKDITFSWINWSEHFGVALLVFRHDSCRSWSGCFPPAFVYNIFLDGDLFQNTTNEKTSVDLERFLGNRIQIYNTLLNVSDLRVRPVFEHTASGD